MRNIALLWSANEILLLNSINILLRWSKETKLKNILRWSKEPRINFDELVVGP